MSIGATAFTAVYAGMTDAQCKLRIDRRTIIAQALVVGIGGERVQTEQGIAVSADVTARTLASSIPTGELTVGDTVEISRTGTDWTEYRIMSRVDTAGIARLTLIDKTNAQ
jgi:hypothetical protein